MRGCRRPGVCFNYLGQVDTGPARSGLGLTLAARRSGRSKARGGAAPPPAGGQRRVVGGAAADGLDLQPGPDTSGPTVEGLAGALVAEPWRS